MLLQLNIYVMKSICLYVYVMSYTLVSKYYFSTVVLILHEVQSVKFLQVFHVEIKISLIHI